MHLYSEHIFCCIFQFAKVTHLRDWARSSLRSRKPGGNRHTNKDSLRKTKSIVFPCSLKKETSQELSKSFHMPPGEEQSTIENGCNPNSKMLFIVQEKNHCSKNRLASDPLIYVPVKSTAV